MTSAGVGVAVHLDGFTAAGLAAHRALTAAGPDAAVEIAMVFAGTRHDDDEYSGVLSAVRADHPGRAHHRLLGHGGPDRRRRGRERHGGRGPRARRTAAADAASTSGGAGRAARGGRAARARGAARAGRRARPARRSRCSSIRRSSTRPTSWPGIADVGAGSAHHGRGRLGRRVGLPRLLEGRRAGRRLRRAGLPARAAPQHGDDPGLPGGRRSADHHRGRGEPDPGDRRAPGGRGAGEDALQPATTRGCAR